MLDDDANADAFRALLLGRPLDDVTRAVLEREREAAGYPPGRYPLPSSQREPGLAASAVASPDRPEPPRSLPARHERYDPTVAEQVGDRGGRPPLRCYRGPAVG